jgi:hypothetical protein
MPKIRIYECEKWFLSLKAEHKLQCFGHKIRKILGPLRDGLVLESVMDSVLWHNI